MSEQKMKFSILLSIIMCCILLISLSTSTFAWFTNNAMVNTSTVSGKTTEQSVQLELSSTGGDEFKNEKNCPISQINATDQENLMPVSTADLNTFVYCPFTKNSVAVAFSKVEEEKFYYHGRVYLKVVAENFPEGTKVKLYFDESEIAGGKITTQEIAGGEESQILTASRLGLVLSGDTSVSHIFKLVEDSSIASERKNNTQIDGELLGEGKVLTWENEKVVAKDDPASLITQYVYTGENALPGEELFTIEANKEYVLDIYFYLEGCDPDCTEAISFDACDFHLAFFGVVN